MGELSPYLDERIGRGPTCWAWLGYGKRRVYCDECQYRRGRRRSTGPTRDVVDAVYDRASHSCELCAAGLGPVRGVDHHLHHRRPRAMGGTDRPDTNLPSNLLLLCPPCHEDIESRRGDALRCGLLLSQVCDPATTAVRLAGPRWAYLTTDGAYAPHPPKERR